MRFEIVHTFLHPIDAVEAALLDAEVTCRVAQRMSTLQEVQPLSCEDDGEVVRRRVRYRPEPLIRRVGPKKVDPRWMEWCEESEYRRSVRRMQFKNVPSIAKIARLLVNHGSLTLKDLGDGRTERVVQGELKVKVPLLGRIAEKIIHRQAIGILNEEARALSAVLAEGSG